MADAVGAVTGLLETSNRSSADKLLHTIQSLSAQFLPFYYVIDNDHLLTVLVHYIFKMIFIHFRVVPINTSLSKPLLAHLRLQ